MDGSGGDNLAHYGIKGMRWGVSRSRAQLATAKSERSEIKRNKKRTRYGTSAKNLTNDELNTRIKRMETEKRYRELNKRTVSTGEKMAVDILKTVSTDTAKKVGNGVSGLAVKVALNKQMEGLGDAVLPKQKSPKDKKSND